MTASRHAGRPRVSRFVARVAFVVVAGLLLALAVDVARVGGPRAWMASRGIPAPYVAQGRLVEVNGRSIYLDCRGQGSPTVLLESGMGDGAGAWSSVQDAAAATTRVCVYDRAGRGSSTARGRHTLSDGAADLRVALANAGEAGPFVVVGHSLGGAYARIFAAAHRHEMAGLLLVDAFMPDLERIAVHPLLGPLRPEYEARLDGLRALVARVESLDWPSSEAQLRAADLRGLAIEVLRAPRGESRLDGATNEAIEAAVVASYKAMSPGRVRYALAWGAGHSIQVDRPDLVIEGIERLVDAARAGSG